MHTVKSFSTPLTSKLFERNIHVSSTVLKLNTPGTCTVWEKNYNCNSNVLE